MTLAEWIVTVGTAYQLAGLLYGGWFVAFGVSRFDPAARGTSAWFRLLLLPGCVALWPVLVVRWLSRTGTP